MLSYSLPGQSGKLGKRRETTMIPNRTQARALWDKYQIPESKRRHLELVADVAEVMADALETKGIEVEKNLLLAGALLHDIDKNVQRLPGEQHPDTAVRILNQEGMEEVSRLVKTHSLHSILTDDIAPHTWEEKLLFLADKMVKYDVITVDERFRLWKNEGLPQEGREIIQRTYPKVKKLEKEILDLTDMTSRDIARVVKTGKKSTI